MGFRVRVRVIKDRVHYEGKFRVKWVSWGKE
jgi:hypothetical protein